MTTEAEKTAAIQSLNKGNLEDGNAATPWEGKRPEELAGMASEDLSAMSFKDLEKAMGIDVADRTDDEPGTGGAPVHEIERQVASGEAVVATEEALAVIAATALNPEPTKTDKDEAAPATEAKPAAAAAATTAAAAPAAAVEETVLLAKDGKNVIPHDVLVQTRAALAKMTAENERLKSGKPEAKPGDDIQGPLSDEELAALESEFPEPVVAALKKLAADNRDLRKAAAASKADAGADDEARAVQAVQDAIDSDPLLSVWQAEAKNGNTGNWDRAVRFDNMLMEDPEWSKKSEKDRFSQVRALMGHPVSASTEKTPAQLAQEAADAAVAAAGKRPTIVPTHSDLPGGLPAAQTEQAQLSQLTTVSLEKMFENAGSMEQVDALLAKFG